MSAMAEWNGCYCGEFSQPTIAPDEFGETCFHEHDKCEVPTTKVPDQTVIRLLKQKVDALTERAEKAEAARDRLANQLLNEVPDSYIQMKARALDAEAAIQRVREEVDSWPASIDKTIAACADSVLRALEGADGE